MINYLDMKFILFFLLLTSVAFSQTNESTKGIDFGGTSTTEPDTGTYLPSTVDTASLQQSLNYPEIVLEKRLEGRVILEFFINADSTISDISVQESDDPVFNEAAIEALRNVRCTPAIQNNVPVQTWVSVSVFFRFEKKRTE